MTLQAGFLNFRPAVNLPGGYVKRASLCVYYTDICLLAMCMVYRMKKKKTKSKNIILKFIFFKFLSLTIYFSGLDVF